MKGVPILHRTEVECVGKSSVCGGVLRKKLKAELLLRVWKMMKRDNPQARRREKSSSNQ